MKEDYTSRFTGPQIDKGIEYGQASIPRVVVTRRIPNTLEKWNRGRNLRYRFSTQPTFVFMAYTYTFNEDEGIITITSPGLGYLEGIINNLSGDTLEVERGDIGGRLGKTIVVRTRYVVDGANCIRQNADGTFKAITIQDAETTRPGFVVRCGKILYQGDNGRTYYLKTKATGRRKKKVYFEKAHERGSWIKNMMKWRWWSCKRVGNNEAGGLIKKCRAMFLYNDKTHSFKAFGSDPVLIGYTNRKDYDYCFRVQMYPVTRKRPKYYNRAYIEKTFSKRTRVDYYPEI